ncbi:hypothetical protein [Tabrizicola fusiformis]|uniref:hypothetical protein n=1 Tax=Tabrizicola sp. SY72 TaxID=2741673 RepID=UPI0015743D75|nr:hypothetical protein [Tabrizicola sp. SY72]NTT84261.1 hypothetical protein [Tabrizicola sp. SY72]
MNSYVGLAVACPDYFTRNTPGRSAKVKDAAEGADLVHRLTEAAQAMKGTIALPLPGKA